MKRNACIAVVVAGLAASAQGEVVDFTIYENASGGDVSALLMTVELIDAGTGIDFVFRNQSTTSSVVTSVYFESTDAIDGLLVDGAVGSESIGVDFDNGASPSNPAQLTVLAGGLWGGTAYAAGAQSPPPHNGINEVGNESLGIHFEYGGGADFDAIVDALTSDPAQFRIAMHIQSVGASGFSVWGTTVPAPASAGLLALGGLVAARRRR